MKQVIAVIFILTLTGCAHFGLDSPADISAENCYAYRYGDKLRRINFVQAFDWCHRSANVGSANSQVLLAELYYMGLGGPQDLSQAEQWYLKAAKQGHAHGQFMLYKIYLARAENNRLNQEKYLSQLEQASYWLRQAKHSGYHFAMDVKNDMQNNSFSPERAGEQGR